MSGIETLFDQLEAFTLAPVASWHPEKTVDINIRIDSTGIWHYQGSPIRRHRIAKLFSTVLRREGEDFYLVTPPVKYRISVDDAPFSAIELNRQGQGVNQNLYFRTNMDEVVLADRDHPIVIEIDNETEEPSPYVEVRDGLNAKMTRPVFYQIAELLVSTDSSEADRVDYSVYSGGALFMVDCSQGQRGRRPGQ